MEFKNEESIRAYLRIQVERTLLGNNAQSVIVKRCHNCESNVAFGPIEALMAVDALTEMMMREMKACLALGVLTAYAEESRLDTPSQDGGKP